MAYSRARLPILFGVGQRHAFGSYPMKVVLRLIERIAHWFALLIAIAVMIAFGVLVGRPSEKGGNQPNFVGAEQPQKRLAVFLPR
jgi:hypothetical protein